MSATEPCHCGRPATANGTLGYSRGMCEDCDAWRCDVYPAGCRHLTKHEMEIIGRWRIRQSEERGEQS